MKGLMDQYTSHEMVITRLKEKVEAKDSELRELMTWKDVQVSKLDYTKQLLKESEAQVEALKKILKDKEAEISEAKCHLRQAKEDTMREYRDSNTLLKELGGSFADRFDNCFRKVKASYPDLDLSHVSIDTPPQTPTKPIYSEGIDELFTDETNPNPQVNRDATQANQEKSVEEGIRQLEVDQTAEEKEEETPIA